MNYMHVLFESVTILIRQQNGNDIANKKVLVYFHHKILEKVL